jgi:hypothetical protein
MGGLDMDPFLRWLEETALSIWVRESPSIFVFPGMLTLHAIGMAFLAGTCLAIDFRTLGFASGVKLASLRRFFPLLWLGFVLNAFSGLMLLVAYPTKALTNPVFYLKLGLIALALIDLRLLDRSVLRQEALETLPVPIRGKVLAGTSIVFWIGAITAGRLLAYTHSRLLVDF